VTVVQPTWARPQTSLKKSPKPLEKRVLNNEKVTVFYNNTDVRNTDFVIEYDEEKSRELSGEHGIDTYH
jgi:hypothetical protein